MISLSKLKTVFEDGEIVLSLKTLSVEWTASLNWLRFWVSTCLLWLDGKNFDSLACYSSYVPLSLFSWKRSFSGTRSTRLVPVGLGGSETFSLSPPSIVYCALKFRLLWNSCWPTTRKSAWCFWTRDCCLGDPIACWRFDMYFCVYFYIILPMLMSRLYRCEKLFECWPMEPSPPDVVSSKPSFCLLSE